MEKQWEVGKTYKLVKEEAFLCCDDSEPVLNVIGKEPFTVTSVKPCGDVNGIAGHVEPPLDFSIWFSHSEIKFFEEVTTNIVPTKDSVAEWLDKACYVYTNDESVESFVLWDEVKIVTSHGDIQGTQQVVEFINNRYELLQKEAKSNKQKELVEKKAKLLEELSAIDKELEGI